MSLVEADWTWIDGAFAAGVQIEIDGEGRITRVGVLGLEPDQRLAGRALLPGFVNVHSHAFQRGLRGRGERFPAGVGSFWTWREAMYQLVEELDPGQVYALSRAAFDEMRDAGMTTVGEFHYLHHDDSAARDYAFDTVILDAAADSGIRLVLLETYYRTGAIGSPLTGGQRRFAVADPDEYWTQVDRLAAALRGPTQTVGAVAHSIRAAGPAEIAALHAEAKRRGMVFHMHLEEQRQEIAACRAAYGQSPLALIAETLDAGPELTAVHCTHTSAAELAAWVERGAGICLCPLTEANLADGVAALQGLPATARLALGTDSNARLSMLEEMRWLEYVQRLTREARGVLTTPDGDCAARLLASATVHGAAALGIEAGRIEAGCWADFAVVDLSAPELAGWTPATLADSLVFGAGNRALAATSVGGEWRPSRLTS